MFNTCLQRKKNPQQVYISVVHIPRVPALSDFIAMMTSRHQRPTLWYPLWELLESTCFLNNQNPTTRSLNILKIKLKYNMMILPKLTPKEKRNLNNKSALRSWRNGSHIGTLTSRRCFATMDEKGWR